MEVDYRRERRGRVSGVTAKLERPVTSWLIRHYPNWISPDLLTYCAFLSSVFAAMSYAASKESPLFLWIASLFIFIHWVTDSTDGGLAIYRRRARPNYGYYADHMLDMVSVLVVAIGAAIGDFVDWELAFAIVSLYYLWTIHSAFMDKIRGKFVISYFGIGPTETRIGIVAMNAAKYFFPKAMVLGQHIVNVAITFVLASGTILLAIKIVQSVIELRREDEDRLKKQ